MSESTHICNCACSLCLSGGCCMLPQPNVPFTTWPTTLPSTTTWPWPTTVSFHEHSFAKFDRRRIFCRSCGEFRDAEPTPRDPRDPTDEGPA